jgi:cell division protein FtsI/penicillin-binding protein 2
VVLSTLSVRLFHIEAFRSDSLGAQAREHYEARETLPARRGRIYDRSGELLARSQTVYTLEVDPYHLRDPLLACIALGERDKVSPQAVRKRHLPEELAGLYREYVAESVALILDAPIHEIARQLREENHGAIILAKDIEDDFARQVEKVIDAKKLGGVMLRPGERRYYPSPMSLTQVIGYVDEKGVGVAGVEKIFEEEMRGTNGFRFCERDRSRREIRAYRGQQVDPVPGRDVFLTIDMGVQSIVERELDAVIDRFRPAKATVILLDPSNGEVIAMASRPHFDLSTRKGIRGQEPVRRNPAVSDLYQPGSTFKIVGFGGAFDRGLADPATEVDCHMGEYALDGFTLRDHHPYGKLTARVAFAKSSNIGAYLVSRPLNKELFHHYVKQFGFGSKTGIELNAEHAGRVIPVERWSAPSFSSQVMGYEVSVTPLQMAMACSVIANDGVLLTPTILRGVKEDVRGSDLVKGPERESRRVISEKAAHQVMQCMMETMGEHGTGTKGDLPGYTVAGKTGTARKHVENVGYVDGLYVASFMGFLPAENPRLLGLVVIDEPKATGSMVYGGAVAAPVFQSIASEAVKILGIEPDLPDELLSPPTVPLASAQPGGEAR